MSAADGTCYYFKGHYIPQCIGGGFRGEDYCTCARPSPTTTLEKLAARIVRLEKRLAEMDGEVKHGP